MFACGSCSCATLSKMTLSGFLAASSTKRALLLANKLASYACISDFLPLLSGPALSEMGATKI